ncbi:MAG: PT domain-containing protein [Clostridia bacterium]|nr:PT domain-containing protein [Clostridia bacterium]
MKKGIALIMTMVILFTLAACSTSAPKETDKPQETEVQTAETPTTQPTQEPTPEPTQAPTPEPTEEPAADGYQYSKVVLAENEYYRMELRSLYTEPNADGTWNVTAEVAMINTYGEKYLLFDPGKQGVGYEPGRDWFEPDKAKFMAFRFTSSSKDLSGIQGEFSYDIDGFTWDGTSASPLFKQTVKATLQLSKDNPVVNSQIIDR